ncbi:FAD-dependent oxidoreductase [Acidothermaceae bacterium B102]|nr:FAD-dependent oxidoreductase [Acidothermaceae bacterium B102]
MSLDSDDYRATSLWLGTVPGSLEPRAAYEGHSEVDVAIIGGGFTGLWTAYYLHRLDPALSIAVLEAEIAGFGASGRNGGWASALFSASHKSVAAVGGRDGAVAQQRAMNDTVDEIGRVAAAEQIDCHYSKGGTLTLARTPAQLARIEARLEDEKAWGLSDVDYLDASVARGRLGAVGVLGGLWTPHCASIHPARLARGLADVLTGKGVRIYEKSPVLSYGPRRVHTGSGVLHAKHVIRATEAWTATLPGQRRAVLPVYSLMIATEPLPQAFWDEIGWNGRETMTDGRHLLIYAQRTADDRIAFGGRGAPYHFRSRIKPSYDQEPAVFAELQRSLVELFPAVADAAITHRWGGPLAAPRDWFSSVRYDARTGLGEAGGYVGDGVSTTNLAGRTLADLVLGRDTELTRLPWVGHESRRWEPEPLRYLGVNAGRLLAVAADREEALTRRPSVVGRLANAYIGH